jgi:hypothetical protein
LWKESNSCTIDALPNVTAIDFHLFLKYLYLKKLRPKHAWAVWHLCDYFDVLTSFQEDVVHLLLKTPLTVSTARKFIPLVNRMIVDGCDENSLAATTQKRFLQFVINNSKALADNDFPFGDLEQPILKILQIDLNESVKTVKT